MQGVTTTKCQLLITFQLLDTSIAKELQVIEVLITLDFNEMIPLVNLSLTNILDLINCSYSSPLFLLAISTINADVHHVRMIVLCFLHVNKCLQ